MSDFSQVASGSAQENSMESDEIPTYIFIIPTRKIFDERDLEEFKKSSCRTEITNFIKMCSKAVYGKKASDVNVTTTALTITKFQQFMDRLYALIDEVPPLHQPMRYGNRAFRAWHARMMVEAQAFLVDILGVVDHARAAVIELAPYLHGAFGVRTKFLLRII